MTLVLNHRHRMKKVVLYFSLLFLLPALGGCVFYPSKAATRAADRVLDDIMAPPAANGRQDAHEAGAAHGVRHGVPDTSKPEPVK